jgi:hypothetical protein
VGTLLDDDLDGLVETDVPERGGGTARLDSVKQVLGSRSVVRVELAVLDAEAVGPEGKTTLDGLFVAHLLVRVFLLVIVILIVKRAGDAALGALSAAADRDAGSLVVTERVARTPLVRGLAGGSGLLGTFRGPYCKLDSPIPRRQTHSRACLRISSTSPRPPRGASPPLPPARRSGS